MVLRTIHWVCPDEIVIRHARRLALRTLAIAIDKRASRRRGQSLIISELWLMLAQHRTEHAWGSWDGTEETQDIPDKELL